MSGMTFLLQAVKDILVDNVLDEFNEDSLWYNELLGNMPLLHQAIYCLWDSDHYLGTVLTPQFKCSSYPLCSEGLFIPGLLFPVLFPFSSPSKLSGLLLGPSFHLFLTLWIMNRFQFLLFGKNDSGWVKRNVLFWFMPSK